jgi:hypothetical protein
MAVACLAAKVDGCYQITDLGLKRLLQFTDKMLGATTAIEAELRNHPPYQETIEFTAELIDKDLLAKCDVARNKAR